MMLIMGIVAGAGLMGVREFRLPARVSARLRVPFIKQNIGNILCLILVGVTLAICIPIRQDIPYYRMIDKEDYQAFIWIRDNVDDSYEKAILDPWKATAFSATAEKYVYTRIHAYPRDSDEKAYQFLRKDCTDTNFLRENGISIIYTRGSCNNPDLEEVRRNIYLLKEAKKSQ